MFPGALRTFHAVVKAGSITRAGKDIGLAPSSVSRQIAILERQIGTVLLNRSPAGVEPTYAGTLVMEYAARALVDFDILRSELNDGQGGRRCIRVAMDESAASGGLAEAIAALRSEHPLASFDIQILSSSVVTDAIKGRQCDVGITFNAIYDFAVASVATLPAPIVLALPVRHGLAGRSAISLKEIAEISVALPGRDVAIRQVFDDVCRREGVNIRPVLECNAFNVLRDFVQCGAGAAILPYRAASREYTGCMSILSIDSPALQGVTLNVLALRQYRIPRVTSLFIESLSFYLRSEIQTDPDDNNQPSKRMLRRSEPLSVS